jgi:hypothetical protein
MNMTLTTLTVAALAALSLAACLSSDAVTDRLLSSVGSEPPEGVQRASTEELQPWPLGMAP